MGRSSFGKYFNGNKFAAIVNGKKFFNWWIVNSKKKFYKCSFYFFEWNLRIDKKHLYFKENNLKIFSILQIREVVSPQIFFYSMLTMMVTHS